MLLPPRPLITLEYICVLAVLASSGCGNDVGTSSATETTATTAPPPTTTEPPPTSDPTDPTEPPTSGSGGGGGETGVLPDPTPCPLEFQSCFEDADCCPNLGHPGNRCPEGPYPDRWTCTTGQCQQDSCSDHPDCVIRGFECREVGGAMRCVAPCSGDADCWDRHIMKNTKCIGESVTTGFCIEDIPSP